MFHKYLLSQAQYTPAYWRVFSLRVFVFQLWFYFFVSNPPPPLTFFRPPFDQVLFYKPPLSWHATVVRYFQPFHNCSLGFYMLNYVCFLILFFAISFFIWWDKSEKLSALSHFYFLFVISFLNVLKLYPVTVLYMFTKAVRVMTTKLK